MEDFLSPEEEHAVSQLTLSQIQDELDKPNNLVPEINMETQLYTGPYGRIQSPFKKYSSFKGFPCGTKRSPMKLNAPAAKRKKLFHKGSSESSNSDTSLTTGTADKNCTEIGEVVNTDDSSDDDQWEIIEDDPPAELDQALDDKSSKFSLSVMNVKSIIHKIITNESVVEMVRKAVLEEMDEHEMKFEPKMTRSKLKEFEAQGQVPLNWGLSPQKKRQSPNFLEMELPEDEEEDEDFTPTMAQESDEDSESVQSSYCSDIGSPMPSTPQSMPSTPKSMPSTPTVVSVQSTSTSSMAEHDLTANTEENSQNFCSPMGPPLQTTVLKSGCLGKKYQDAMERDKQRSEEEAELIASRTRSKLPMNDCSLLDIEAGFIAPDITQDMYETCDDLDWAEFLSTLITFPDDTIKNHLNTTNEEEDTEDDPEYNFQEEIETLEYDREDFRDDRAVKVSKKEMNMLLDDVLNNEDYDTIDEQYKITIKTQSEKIVFNSNKKKQTQYQQSLISAIGDHERKQIDDQLRKHVQQLTQTYVMSQNGIAEHKPMGHTARFYLNELKNFAEKSEEIYVTSAYRVSNLDLAIRVVEDRTWQQEAEVPENIKERMESLTFKHDSLSLPALNYGQMSVMWNSPVFMFPELLPYGGFFKQIDIKRDRARVKFLESEDNLLAMGLAQFSHLKNDAKDYIQRFMLPCKSRKQIEIRIKNLSAKAAKGNAVKFFRTYRRLPKFYQHAPDFDISMQKSLKDSHHAWDELPWWCRFFCADDECAFNESVRSQWERQKEIKRRRKEKHSINYTLSESDVADVLTPPPVPSYEQTDSSISGSSENESTVLRKRPRQPRRKKLNNQKNDMGIVGSFVPLPLPGSSVPQHQPGPLTICVLDNIQAISSVQNSSASLDSLVPRSVAIPCSQPTVFVINKNVTMQQESFKKAAIPDSTLVYTQSTIPYTHISPQIPLSMALTCDASSKNESDMDTKPLTFEDICRPILETEMEEAAKGQADITDSVLSTLYTEKHSVSDADGAKCVVVNVVESVSENNTECDVDTVAEHSTRVADMEPASTSSSTMINHSTNKDDPEKGMCKVQSSEISSTVLEDQMKVTTFEDKKAFDDNAKSPFSIDNVKQDVTVQAEHDVVLGPSVEEQEIDGTVGCTHSLIKDRSVTTQHVQPHNDDCSAQTSEQLYASSDVSGGEQNQKSSSSIEIVASLAPYYISPVRMVGSQQNTLETTPTKKKLPDLFPKSELPSQRSAQALFTDLKSSPHKQIKASLRKKRLQQHVKTILPKGFVASSFDLSPAKKAASGLVDKAKHLVNSSKGFCKILPHPNQTISERHNLFMKKKKRKTKKFARITRKKDVLIKSRSYTEIDNNSGHVHDDEKEKTTCNKILDEDDRCGDTESDFTQSEDGNETQGTDGEDVDTQGTDDWEGTHGTDWDSQDSQEEDNHIADLMAASTTMGFVQERDDLYSVSRLGKKDRNRDLTLALLKPDIVAADPQRDLRDTLFAQAYIHKVKKVLRDDEDKLEKFLRIMYDFNQDGTSPVKLYNDLQELFSNQPELIHDFASFLQAEQALECGCYNAYQELNNARKFLRKLEIYFVKNPNQLQKVMRTFSRWFKKPGRKELDIREQIEPLLKGQKLLLEEFSTFFADGRPTESMEDFEEVDLENCGENEDKDTSYEEINLLHMEEVYGTKRCPCRCHSVGDDTYRKKKKHCYSCCLTVIDGEMVYKVNKTTMKKINVTFGPPIKLSSLNEDRSELRTKVTDSSNGRSQDSDITKSNALETENRQASSVDFLMDEESAEKEDSEYLSEETDKNKEKASQRKLAKGKVSPNKESILQKIINLKRNKPKEKDKVTQLENEIKSATNRDEVSQEAMDISYKNSYSSPQEIQNDKEDKSANEGYDILASALNGALTTGVSTESMSFPLDMTANNKTELVDNERNTPDNSLHNFKNNCNTSVSDATSINSTVITSVFTKSVSVSVPVVVQNNSYVSNDSSFQKEQTSENRNMCKETAVMDPSILPKETKEKINKCKEEGQDNLIPCKRSMKDFLSESSKSPLNQLFPPVSQKKQCASSVSSPGITVQSQEQPNLLSSTCKPKRIVPKPFKESEEKANSNSSFQTAMENSPVFQHCADSSPYVNIELQKGSSIQNVTNISNSCDNTEGVLGNVRNVFTVDSDSQKLGGASQKSNRNSTETLLPTTVYSEPGFTSMVIGQPDIFSENANVGFPKVTSSVKNSSLSQNEILSEESLFQCISKPTQFIDAIPSVSNLTNILHVLDGHSQGKMLHEHSHDDENKIAECDKNPIEESSANESISFLSNFVEAQGRSTFQEMGDNVEKNYREIRNEVPNISENNFGDSGIIQAVNFHSQSVTNSKNTENFTDKLLQENMSVDDDKSITEVIDEKKTTRIVTEKGADRVSKKLGKGKKKKHKMSSRELGRSLQSIVQNVVGRTVSIANKDGTVNAAYGVVEHDVHTSDNWNEVQVKKENDAGENVSSKKKLSCDEPVSLNEGCDVVISSGQIKTEESTVLNCPSTSDVQSVCDTVGEDSHRGKKRSKHLKNKHKYVVHKDKHRKKKRKAEKCESTQKADKKKKKETTCNREKPELSRLLPANEKTASVVQKDQHLKEDTVAASKDKDYKDKGAEEMIPISRQEEKKDDEPKWSKDTDKSILENCKEHGIKEKTFVKIAREIGNVSSRQVRMRFNQLYQMIFGCPVEEKTSE